MSYVCLYNVGGLISTRPVMNNAAKLTECKKQIADTEDSLNKAIEVADDIQKRKRECEERGVYPTKLYVDLPSYYAHLNKLEVAAFKRKSSMTKELTRLKYQALLINSGKHFILLS